MTGEYSELVVEFSVILLSPILHNYYLWKVKKVDFTEIKKKYKNILSPVCINCISWSIRHLEISLIRAYPARVW